MGAHQTKMMGKVALLFVVAMAASANAISCTTTTCASIDGSTAAPTGGCYCGNDNVFVAATQFCYKKADNMGLAMTKPLCAQITGATTNGATLCTCSKKAATPLTTGTGNLPFCLIGSNDAGFVTAAAQEVCPNQVAGAAVSGSKCFCGETSTTTDAVEVAVGGYCFKRTTTNIGIAMTHPLCAQITGATTNGGTLCTCSKKAATPLTTGTGNLPFCLIGSNDAGFVTAAAQEVCPNQ